MNNDELKDYIDQAEMRLNKAVDLVMKCVADLKKKVDDVKSLQLRCPVLNKVEELEALIITFKGRVFRSNVLVFLFLGLCMFLLKLHLFTGEEIKPKDVHKRQDIIMKDLEDIKKKLK